MLRDMVKYVLVSAPVALTMGSLTVGRLSDKYGRKYTFMFTLALYGVDPLLIILSGDVF